jgi:BASS family bile acid:Na+ symporter
MKNLYRISFFIALVCFIVVFVMVLSGNLAQAGLLVVTFFITIGIGFRGFTMLKEFSFTAMIFGVVALALYYPEYFNEINGYELSGLIIPLIMIIMFGLGTTMSLKAFHGVIKAPKGVFLGFFLQFTVMPLIGFTLANFSNFPAEIAAGLILIGCSPSGVASNVMAYIGKANLPLSLTITSVNTLFAPLMTPFLMFLLAGSYIEISTTDMMWSITKMVILPVGAGILFNEFLHGKFKWLDDAMPVVSMIGIGVIILIATALGRDSLLTMGPLLFVLVLVHNLSGYTLGYWSSRLLKMSEIDCRTIAIEVGMQNAGLAKGIAQSLGKLATLGLAPLLFGPLMNVTGSILAIYWHRHPVEGQLDISDFMKIKKNFDHSMLTAGHYRSHQLESQWTDEIKNHFIKWLEQHPSEPSLTREQLEIFLEKEEEKDSLIPT